VAAMVWYCVMWTVIGTGSFLPFPTWSTLGWFWRGDGGGSECFGSDGGFDTVEVVR
jgi:hypothetical protein